MVINGSIEVRGSISVTENVAASGSMTVAGDVTASGVSLVDHVHGGILRGGATTDAPQ